MWCRLLLWVALLAAGGRALPSLPTSDIALETFEPEPRVLSVLDLLAAFHSRLREHDDRLKALEQQQTKLSGQLERLLRRLPEYPACELVTVARGRQFRLTGDVRCSRGRVQWRIRGHYTWHQLCDKTAWSRQDAAVACRSLGFTAGAAGAVGVDGVLVGSAAKGPARGFGITCDGSEEHLWECQLEDQSHYSDGCPAHTTPVTVTCSGGK